MKEKSELNIVFMGTPDFAATILDTLLQEEYRIKAVVTAPDRPAGRGRKLNESAVKKLAKEHHLAILQPTNLKDEDFICTLKEYEADLFIVVAFRMLPKVVWEIPTLGTFNLHASLLPQYRGAAPINWAIINGESETGVTTFFIDEKIDTGEILLKEKVTIGENETAGELHDRLMHIGATVVVNTVELIRQEKANPQAQKEGELKTAPKIFKEDCLIDFSLPIQKLHNFIRGMSPYPTAWLKLLHTESKQEKTLKVFRSEVISTNKNNKVELLQKDKQLILATQTGELSLTEVQLEGKKRLDTAAFLLGFNVKDWEIINN